MDRIRGTNQVIRNTIDFAIGSLASLAILLYLAPIALWYDSSPELVIDSEVGEEIFMITDRQIRRDFTGAWKVTLREVTPRGLEQVCLTGLTEQRYLTTATHPEPLPLNWWTYSRCLNADGVAILGENLPKGEYLMTTCHWVYLPLGFSKNECRTSNTFRVESPEG